MNKPKAWTMAAIAVALGAVTYGVLELLAPPKHEDLRMEGLVSTAAVFGDNEPAAAAPPAPVAVAATSAEPAAEAAPAEVASPEPMETVGADLAPPPQEDKAPATAPAKPAALPEPVPAAAAQPQAAKPIAKPAPAPQPKTKPAAKPQAKPEARPTSKPAAAPAPTATAPAAITATSPESAPKAAANSGAWWQNATSSSGLQVTYVGSASFKRAIVVLADGQFASPATGDQAIAVLDSSGRQVNGVWEMSSVNRAMLVFPIPVAGTYQVIIGGRLSDAQNRSLGVTLRGSIDVK